MKLPVVVEDLDPATVTQLLDERYPGVRVAGVEVVERHELTNSHARLHLAYEAPVGAPEVVFAKLPPSEAERRKTINATGMGRKEALFYGTLASSLELRTPAVHAAAWSDDGGFVLLLEDLPTSGCTTPDGTVGVAPDAAAVALEELAAMHVRFESAQLRPSWIEPAGPGSNYAVDMLRFGIEHHRDRLTDAFVAVAELYCERRLDLQRLWHAGRHTVVHGDPHLGNVFDDHGRTGFLDWGITMLSTRHARRQLLPHHGHGRRCPPGPRARPARPLRRRPVEVRRCPDGPRRRLAPAPGPVGLHRPGQLPGRAVPARHDRAAARLLRRVPRPLDGGRRGPRGPRRRQLVALSRARVRAAALSAASWR
jgi:hypothetical protein